MHTAILQNTKLIFPNLRYLDDYSNQTSCTGDRDGDRWPEQQEIFPSRTFHEGYNDFIRFSSSGSGIQNGEPMKFKRFQPSNVCLAIMTLLPITPAFTTMISAQALTPQSSSPSHRKRLRKRKQTPEPPSLSISARHPTTRKWNQLISKTSVVWN